MAFNSNILLLVFLIALILFVAHALHKAKNHTYCMFIRGDGTWINKWAKPKQTRIDFDNGWYYLNPKFNVSKVLDFGIYRFFPTKVDGQIFTYGNPDPLDPYKFEIAALTPEARKALNKREDIEAYSQGNRTSLQIKQRKGLFEAWMPMIMVAGFAIMGYFVYILNNRIDQVGFGMNVVQQMLQELLAR